VAYFEALAALDEADPAWTPVSAGLVVLRLVDAWLEDGPSVVAPDAWGVHAVRAALAEVPDAQPMRAILAGVVDAMTEAPVADMGLVAPRLMAYARALDFEARYALAADVYRMVIGHVHPLEDCDVAIDANMRLGYCCRMMGQWDESAVAYHRAGGIGANVGDMMAVLHARIGDAKLASARGNQPAAEAILEEAIARADELQLRDLRAIALHDRAGLAYQRGDFERSIRYAYEALESTTTARERDRVLADIATAFLQLGVRSAARDAHLILASTAQEQYSRWASTLNLMVLASLEGQETVFEQYRRSLADADLPPATLGNYHLYVGRGYRVFGRDDLAAESFRRAAEVAERYQLNKLSFEVEAELRSLPHARPAPRVPAAAVPDAIVDVADAVGRIRAAVGV
jgi:tetratricopeptide (TPR) repeat protein